MTGTRKLTVRERGIEFAVGLFFFAALIILAVFTIFIKGATIWDQSPHLQVQFNTAYLLQKGDKVMVRGMPVGTVAGLALSDDNKGVIVDIRLDEKLHIYKNYSIYIHSSSLLGGQYIAINPGDLEKGELHDTILTGEQSLDIMSQAKPVLKNLNKLLISSRRVISKLERGEGTIGKLLTDVTLYKRMNDLSLSIQNIGNRASGLLDKAEMTLGSIERAAVEFRKFISDLNSSEGNLVKSIHNVQDITKTVKAWLDNKESTPARFLTDKGELYSDLSNTLSELKQTVREWRTSKGSFHKFLNDPSLFNDAKSVLKDLRKMINDIREQMPVTTFGSLIFGGF